MGEQLDIANQMASQSSDRSNWWKQKWLELNPQVRPQRTELPAYDAALGDLSSKVGGLAAQKGYTGDLADYINPAAGQLRQMGGIARAGALTGDYFSNRGRGAQAGAENFQKGMGLMGRNDVLSRIRDENRLSMAGAQDAILRAQQSAKFDQPDPLASAIGAFGGEYFGTKLGRYDNKKHGDFLSYLF